MKKLFILFFAIILVYSCTNSDSNNNFDSSNFSTDKFVGNVVAFQDKDEIKLGISDNDLIHSFNNYSKKLNLGLQAVSTQIEKINGKNYIRFINKDGSVSTVALLNVSDNPSDNNKLAIGRTICSTTTSSNCSGCLPDGNYCSSCENNSRDCSRTTSS
jgi:hypothetical protein